MGFYESAIKKNHHLDSNAFEFNYVIKSVSAPRSLKRYQWTLTCKESNHFTK